MSSIWTPEEPLELPAPLSGGAEWQERASEYCTGSCHRIAFSTCSCLRTMVWSCQAGHAISFRWWRFCCSWRWWRCRSHGESAEEVLRRSGLATSYIRSWSVGVSEKKVAWLVQWVDRLVAEGQVLGREFKAGIGRMGFLAGAATSARVGPTSFVTLHMAVKLSLTFFKMVVSEKPRKIVSNLPRVLGEVFRVDAMADQDGIAVGGWESYNGRSPSQAQWFSLKLTKKNAPWLYVKGEPFRVIAAAELVGVLVALVVFGKEAVWKRGAGRLRVSGFTDNLGNSYVLDRFFPWTSCWWKWPTSWKG